jgi:hypothetical protein
MRAPGVARVRGVQNKGTDLRAQDLGITAASIQVVNHEPRLTATSRVSSPPQNARTRITGQSRNEYRGRMTIVHTQDGVGPPGRPL